MKKKIFILVLIVVGLSGAFFPALKRKAEWKMAAEAAGGYPYQIGLTGITVIPCFTTGQPPVCNGGTLCYTRDAATCTGYSDVAGMPAGGMGSNALFLKTAIAQAGVVPGGQLIAGGMSMTMMESGVLGGPGGCAGCVALEENKNVFAKTKDYIGAIFK